MEMVGNSHSVNKKKKVKYGYAPPATNPSEDLAKAIKKGSQQPVMSKQPVKPSPVNSLIGSIKSSNSMADAARRKLAKTIKRGGPMMRKES